MMEAEGTEEGTTDQLGEEEERNTRAAIVQEESLVRRVIENNRCVSQTINLEYLQNSIRLI